VLDARIRETGLEPAAYWWYRDLRRYGTVPHAGRAGVRSGGGLCTGMANIRDVIPFPRTPVARLLVDRRAQGEAAFSDGARCGFDPES